jgi:hypothetical protein
MLSKIRKRFTYANVAMTLALVLAMSGGAYAAKKYVITSTKQIKPSVLAQLKGKAGANGANGATGPAGPQGPTGAAGKDGAPGTNGTSGKDGAPGTSVTSTKLNPGNTTCKEGGSEFTAAESKKTFGCNGEKGTQGPEGNIKATLPSGTTETGAFVVNGKEGAIKALSGFKALPVPISFTIPLAASLASSNVHLIGAGEGEGEPKENPAIIAKECSGKASEKPGAASANLCVFLTSEENMELAGSAPLIAGGAAGGASPTGSILLIHAKTEAEAMLGWGVWAVTG